MTVITLVTYLCALSLKVTDVYVTNETSRLASRYFTNSRRKFYCIARENLSLTNSLSRAFNRKMMVARLVKKLLTLYVTRILSIVFREVRH